MYSDVGSESHLGQLTFSLKGRESEPSQFMLLYCLALFDESLICTCTCSFAGGIQHWQTALAVAARHSVGVARQR